MKQASVASVVLAVLLPIVASAATVTTEMKTSVVFIANYNAENEFEGWGSGFFVDEGIIVTNKHVLEGGKWHRVYATAADGMVDFECYKSIQKSDVRINLNDDVAYMRAYLPCAHGMLDFGDDPSPGDPIVVLGYPIGGIDQTTARLTVMTGSVMSGPEVDWMRTDAYLDIGNSGGPVIDDTGVAGVAVAKGTDEDGNYLTGFFIPSSVILDGLLYANNSDFGYIPRSRSSSSRSSAVSSSVSSARPSSSASSASSRRSSSVSSQTPFQQRTCKRVLHWFGDNPTILARANARLQKRFGFVCR